MLYTTPTYKYIPVCKIYFRGYIATPHTTCRCICTYTCVHVHVYVAEKSVTWKLIILIKCYLKHSLISCSVQELGIYSMEQYYNTSWTPTCTCNYMYIGLIPVLCKNGDYNGKSFISHSSLSRLDFISTPV